MRNIARTAAKLNTIAGTVAADEIAEELGDLLAERIGKRVDLNKVSKRDASILMVAFGADDFAVSQHANKVARRMRSQRFTSGGWSSVI